MVNGSSERTWNDHRGESLIEVSTNVRRLQARLGVPGVCSRPMNTTIGTDDEKAN